MPPGATGSTSSSSPSATQAAVLAGEEVPYLDLVARCFDHAPARRPDVAFEEAAARIDALLPGDAPLSDRLADWDRRFEIPLDRLPSVVDWLVARFRAQAAATFGLPIGRGRAPRLRERAAVGRLHLVRRRAPVADRHQHRPALPGHDPAPDHRPRGLPGPPPGARLEGGRSRRPGRPPGGLDPAHQHPGLPDQRGPGEPWPPVRRAAGRPGRPPGRAVRPGRPAAGGRSGRPPARRPS